MKLHSYSFITEAAHKTPLEAVEGTITKIWKRKDGVGRNGKEWSLQDGEFRFPDGNVIKLQWNGCEAVDPGWENVQVRLESNVHDQTGELTGLYAIDDEYNNVTTRKIKLTGSHKIVHLPDGFTGPTAPAQTAPPARTAPPAQSAPPARTAPPAASAPPRSAPPANSAPPAAAAPAGSPDAILAQMRKRIARLAGLQSICYDAAAHVAHGIMERHGIAVMPGAVGVMGDKLFMEAVRRCQDVDLLPMDPYKITPFTGRPLDELLPAMRQQIGEGKAEIDFQATESRMELGRQAAATPPPAARNFAPPAPATTQGAYDPHDPTPQPDDDTVPF